jgi:OOP family OmpA-OmpF porin
MKKLNKIAMLFASAALVTAAGAQTIDNWQNGSSDLVWKNGTNELCWRDSNWTPATAAPGCDGAIVPVVAPAPVAVAPAPIAAPAPAPVAPPAATKSHLRR